MFAAGPPYVSRRTFGFNVWDPKLEAFIPTEPKEMANTKQLGSLAATKALNHELAQIGRDLDSEIRPAGLYLGACTRYMANCSGG